MKEAKTTQWLVWGLAAACLNGCAVGPDFVQPAPPAVTAYIPEGLPDKTASTDTPAGSAQYFRPATALPLQWWTLFGAPRLDRLIEQALRANPTIPAAEATLRAAQENMRAQQGAYLPQASGTLVPSRQRTADTLAPVLNSGTNPYNLHTAQLNIGYSPDVFGLNRRQVEALNAQADYQRFQLEATRITLASNVALAVIQMASLRGQLEATRSTIDILVDQVAIARQQLALGAIAEASLIAQEGTLAQTRSLLPALQKQLAQQHDLLAILTGNYPSALEEQALTLQELHLPDALPLSVPSSLVAHRPDIQSAQAQLQAASAQVGVATANLYPQLTLTAGIGSSATRVADLFAGGTGFWTLAGNLLQPIFQGGTLVHKKRAAQAAYEQALAQYRSTVLSAFQNVADALYAVRFDAETLAAAAAVEHSAQASLSIARKQVELGDASYLALLTFEQAFQQARLATVQAQAARLADSVALFQALGGGWSDTPARDTAPAACCRAAAAP